MVQMLHKSEIEQKVPSEERLQMQVIKGTLQLGQ